MLTQEFRDEVERIKREDKPFYNKYLLCFNAYYSIDTLSKLSGKERAIRMFASKAYGEEINKCPGIAHWASFGIKDTHLFGKAPGYPGILYKNGIFVYYDHYLNDKEEISANYKEISEEEAIRKADELFKVLEECDKLVKDKKDTFTSLDGYIKFEKELKNILKYKMRNFFWDTDGNPKSNLIKYLATSNLGVFAFVYSYSDLRRLALEFLDLSKKRGNSLILLNAEIKEFADKENIEPWVFELACENLGYFKGRNKELKDVIIDCLSDGKQRTKEEICKQIVDSKSTIKIFDEDWEKQVETILNDKNNEEFFIKKGGSYLLNPNAIITDKVSTDTGDENDDGTVSTDTKLSHNNLFYGIAGCGKSTKVENIIVDAHFKEFRTVFYKDYSYNDFVGHLEPYKSGNDIGYRIKAGPFLLALHHALDNPNENVALIIEEINRGDASAILGDIFQLLDRNADGVSATPIVSPLIADYLKENLKEKAKKEFINGNEKVVLPDNLYFFATMNTSDQNVNKLDAAFKRRWSMERITNKDARDSLKGKSFNIPGVDPETSWVEFVNRVNAKIIEEGLEEDRQLGYWFYVNNGNVTAKDFANKVLEYLWNDVLKYSDKSIVFNSKYKTFDDVINDFINPKTSNQVFAYGILNGKEKTTTN